MCAWGDVVACEDVLGADMNMHAMCMVCSGPGMAGDMEDAGNNACALRCKLRFDTILVALGNSLITFKRKHQT